jgi:hypothetical protein
VRLGSSLVVAIVIGLLAGCDATPVVVSGTVTAAPSGTGVGAMAVQIYADDSEVLVTAATTNVSGGWELRASTLADGTYRVRIGDRWWPDAGSWAQAQSMALSAGAATVLDVSVDEVGELTGGVVDDAGEPLAGVAAVLVRVSDGQSVGATETGADGAFVLPVTAAGSYRVLLADPSETWPSVFVGGTTATDFAVSAGTVAVGTIDISTGEPHVSPPVLGTTTRVSLGVGGAEISDGDAQDPAISADGTVVAFASHASDVVVGDANHTDDVFVHDRATGVTSRVSVASDGTEADLWSLDPALSADGRFVAFWSGASNLVAGDTNGSFDVFVHDRSTGVTSRASVASGGAQADGYSARPAISADGRFVTFDSGAPNLVAVTPTAPPTCLCTTGPPVSRPGCRSRRTAPKPTGAGSTPPSVPMGATLRSGRTRPTWCLVTPMALETCSSTTGRPVPPPGCRLRPAVSRPAGATCGLPTSVRTGGSSRSCRTRPTWCRATPIAPAMHSCTIGRPV